MGASTEAGGTIGAVRYDRRAESPPDPPAPADRLGELQRLLAERRQQQAPPAAAAADRLELERGPHTVRGRIEVPFANALAGLEVVAWCLSDAKSSTRSPGSRLPGMRGRRRVLLDEAGRFEFRAMPAGTIDLVLPTAEGDVALLSSAAREKQWTIRADLDLVLVPATPLAVVGLVSKTNAWIRIEPYVLRRGAWADASAARDEGFQLVALDSLRARDLCVTTRNHGRFLADPLPGAADSDPWMIRLPPGAGSVRVRWRTPPASPLQPRLWPARLEWPALANAMFMRSVAPNSQEDGVFAFNEVAAGVYQVALVEVASDPHWFGGPFANVVVNESKMSEIEIDPPRVRRTTLRIVNWDDIAITLRPTAVWIGGSHWLVADGTASVVHDGEPRTASFSRFGKRCAEAQLAFDHASGELQVALDRSRLEESR